MKRKTRQQVKSEVFERLLTLDRAHADTDARTVPISISSETPVDRFFGSEVLVHEKDAINMERAGSENGLPLLLSHDSRLLIGRVRDIKLKDKRLVGVAHFSDNTKAAREAWADVEGGFLTDISVQYQIDELRETINPNRDVDDLVEVTRWTPLEASVVAIPADIHTGINRSKRNEDRTMSEDKAKKPGGKEGVTVADFTDAQDKAKRAGQAAGTALERERSGEINKLFGMHAGRAGVMELAAACITNGETVERSGTLLLEFLAGDPEPIAQSRTQAPDSHGQRIDGAADESDKWVAGITEALEVRGNLIRDKELIKKARQSEFNGMSLGDMARDYLVRQRISLGGMGRQQIAGAAFTRAGMHGTSDFASVLENVANKALLMGYDEAPETWNAWCRVGSLTDFKVASRVNISSFSDLELVLESGEYKEGHLSDLKETIQLSKYGKLFTISREAIINDDTSAFSRIPMAMGMAAARQVGDLAYAVLTANAALVQDAVTLFHADHGNIGTGGVITETTLDEFGKLMAAQTSPAPGTGETGAVLNIRPKFLLVPRAILMAAKKVTQTPTNPSGTAGALDVNTQANQWEVVSDARLDADSAAEYYAAADPNIADTIEVAFLDGNDQPYMESQNGFTQDGVSYKVRIEAAAAALDYRGLCYNAGA